jgi:hypothetical protein
MLAYIRCIFNIIKSIAFNDIGDLLDAEEAMFQEMQEGWITYEEFEAFENSGKMTNYAVFLPSLLSISTKS